jgi:hypothetical protein
MSTVLLFLLSFLIQLESDDGRQVGDVVITLSDKWRDTVGRHFDREYIKLDRMRDRGRKPLITAEELAEQEDLVQNLHATGHLLEVAGGYLYSLGYRPPRPRLLPHAPFP